MSQHNPIDKTGTFAAIHAIKLGEGGRHRVKDSKAKFGIFTYGAIPQGLSFEWLLGKRKFGRGARDTGVSNEVIIELQASHRSYLRNKRGGRHHFISAEATSPSLQLVGA